MQNSHGTAWGGTGIKSLGTVANCYGYTSSTGTDADGIYAARTVQNSYGGSEGDDGIDVNDGLATSSYGWSTGSSASAYGIHANTAVGCRVKGGENITHKFNMP